MGASPGFGSDSLLPPDPAAVERKLVVFVCYGNACRSQMAEGFLRNYNIPWLEGASAGVYPLGKIPRETGEVMKEKEISLAGHSSKGCEVIEWQKVTLLVNMSSMPAAAVAPEYSGSREEWEIPDPFQSPIEEYRRVRDLLGKKVEELVQRMTGKTGNGGSSSALPV